MKRAPLQFEVLQSDAELEGFLPAWTDLFDRSRTRNAFAHPSWLGHWLRQFVPEAARRRILAVYRGDELVAVAPFYYRRVGGGRTLQLAGAPQQEDPLTETSEVLSLPETRRQVLRALIEQLVLEHADGCDWIGLTLPSDHGWFDDDWIPQVWSRHGAFSMLKSVRPYAVLPLAESWEQMPLKRNVRNAVRRSENRHARLGDRVEVRIAEGDAVRDAALEVQHLHRRRAVGERGLRHNDYFDDMRISELAVEGPASLARTGNAYAALCLVDGQPAAGRVVLRAGGEAFLSYSGLDPRHWELSSPTLLISEVIRRAIADGDTSLNLSLNPDSAKQRWTQSIDAHHEFVIVGPSRRSRTVFSLFWQARSARALRDKRRAAANSDEVGAA